MLSYDDDEEEEDEDSDIFGESDRDDDDDTKVWLFQLCYSNEEKSLWVDYLSIQFELIQILFF